jgi:hypothetical protein
MAEAARIEYTAERTAVAFHHATDFVRGLMGPIGSGKSVACVNEAVRRCFEQAPDAQGIRPSRGAIVRNTYGELKTTTIRTWKQWVPESVCWLRSGSPIEGLLRVTLPDGTRVEAEILFIALDRPQDVAKLLSLELTWAWINEAREVPIAVVDGVTSRVGRYPEKKRVALTWSGVFMDTNPPDTDHWWFRIFEGGESDDPVLVELRAKGWGWRLFRQPSALTRTEGADGRISFLPNPAAENVQHQQLGYGYWQRMLFGKSADWIRVYVLGEYGTVEDGKPIYPEYSEQLHLRATDYQPRAGARIVLGWDYGLTPACAFMELTERGVLEIFDEMIATRMGIRQFTEQVNLRLAGAYPHCQVVAEYGDPAGGAAAQTDERSCYDIQRELGRAVSAGAMTLVDRLEGVRWFLTRVVDGEAALKLSPRCRMLRKGFAGAYKYRRLQISYDERFADVPDKNEYSHPHDALNHAVGILARAGRAPQQTVPPRADWRRSGRTTARVA